MVITLIIAVLFIAGYLMYSSQAAKKDDNFTYQDPNNFEIAQAKLQAQATLDRFLQLSAENPECYASVKVALPTGHKDDYEHIWIENVVPGTAETPWQGRLANEPVELPGLKLGSEVSFPQAEIEDWIVSLGDDSMEGGYSVKILNRT